MEIILALAVIVVLCLIFNISTEYIVLGILFPERNDTQR